MYYLSSAYHIRAPWLMFLALSRQDGTVITLRTRKYLTNRLLGRCQFVLDVLHQFHSTISKIDLREKLAAIYETEDKRVVILSLRRHFGGGRSTGFALIYDDEQSQRKFEPKHRLIQVNWRLLQPLVCADVSSHQSGMIEKVEKRLGQGAIIRKARKNWAKKVHNLPVLSLLICLICLCLVTRNYKGQGTPSQKMVDIVTFVLYWICGPP